MRHLVIRLCVSYVARPRFDSKRR